MALTPKKPQPNPFSSKPPRHPSFGTASTSGLPSTGAEPQSRNPNQNPNPNSNPSAMVLASTSNTAITMSLEDQILARSRYITRSELLRRRAHNITQLANCYRDHYWGLMEDLKGHFREYYWKYGVSPFKDDENRPNKRRRLCPEGETGDADAVEGSGDNGTSNGGSNGVRGDPYANSNCGSCSYSGCKAKALALTKYCHLHILKDSKQKLYTGCTYVLKRAPAGPLLCGKPTSSTVPALCNGHFQKAQKHAARALKDAGLNVSSTNRPPPKLHVIVAAFVQHIQAKRRDPRNEGKLKSVVKEENTS